jgi:peptide/nickel transport system substrate-binding protein
MIGKRIALVAGALALALTAACGGPDAATGGQDEGTPTPGGRLSIAISNDPSPVDPLSLVTPTDREVALAVYEPLVELGKDGQLVPGLALSWDAPDAQNWTVKLRPNVKFSDGTPFNADAVIANYTRARTSKTCAACAASLGVVNDITKTDDLTVVFALKSPNAAFPAFLNDTYSNMVSPAALAQYGDDIAKHPVGTGPFLMTSRDAQGFVFDKNPNYWDAGKPYLDGVDMKIIPDPQGGLAALRAGDVDIIHNTTDVINSQVAGNPADQVIQVPGLATTHIFFNNSKAPFDNIKARQAIAYATDRDALLKLTHPGGTPERVDGPWPSGMPVTGAAESAKFPAFDLEKAKGLVSEIGGLSFTLETYNVGQYPAQAQALQSMWGQAGIKVELQVADATTVVADATAQRPQALLTQWSGRPDPDLNAYRYFHSGVRSPVALNDPKMDELLDRGRTTMDPVARKQVYQDFVDYLAETLPAVYFDGLKKSIAINTESVGGATPPPDGNIRLDTLWNKAGAGAN